MSDTTKQQDTFVMFYYLIPTVTDPKTGVKRGAFPNPSNILRRFAIREDLSVWYMKRKRTPTGLRNAMEKAGCVARIREFAEKEYASIMQAADDDLTKREDDIRKFIEDSLAKTAERLEEAKRLQSVDGVNGAISYMRSHFNGAQRQIAAAMECMMEFDLIREKKSLFDALQKSIAAQAEGFMVEHADEIAAKSKRSKAGKGKKA